jgi:hypothetical protein
LIIQFIIQLILFPFDWICFTFYSLIEGILDAILAIVEVPSWQPMYGNVYAFPIWYANEIA